MAQLATIFDCPAFRVIENPPMNWGPEEGLVKIKHGQKLALLREHPRHGTLVETFRVGTVLGSAIDNFEDPDEARERNRRNGGEDHWINGCGTTITAHERAQEILPEIRVGMKVALEGKRYEIVEQPNHNLGLSPL